MPLLLSQAYLMLIGQTYYSAYFILSNFIVRIYIDGLILHLGVYFGHFVQGTDIRKFSYRLLGNQFPWGKPQNLFFTNQFPWGKPQNLFFTNQSGPYLSLAVKSKRE